MEKHDKLEYIEMKVRNKDIEKFNSEIPKVLYKYRILNSNTIDSLENEYIWCGWTKELNDPFECLLKSDEEEKLKISKYIDVKIDLNVKEIREQYDKLKEIEVKKIIQDIIEKKESIVMTSFSEKKDNIMMWSYYADSHKGICIEYSFEDIDKAISNWLLPVIYEEHIIKIGDYLDDQEMGVARQLTTKFIGWQHESEWRMMNPIDDSFYKLEYNNDNSIKGVKVKLKPKRIFLGCNIDKNHEDIIREISDKKGIEVYKFKISESMYELI